MLIGLVVGVITNVALVPVIGATGAVVSQVVASAARLAMGIVALRGSGLLNNPAPATTSADGSVAVKGVQHAAV
jgi:hypothetical protein